MPGPRLTDDPLAAILNEIEVHKEFWLDAQQEVLRTRAENAAFIAVQVVHSVNVRRR